LILINDDGVQKSGQVAIEVLRRYRENVVVAEVNKFDLGCNRKSPRQGGLTDRTWPSNHDDGFFCQDSAKKRVRAPLKMGRVLVAGLNRNHKFYRT
jgi:hypothetical protein